MPIEPIPAEADFLHRRLLGGPAPPEVVTAYGCALRTLFPGDLPRVQVDIKRIVTRQLDPEAIEFYLRLRNGMPSTLTQRIHVLFYLVEPRPEYDPRFALVRPARLRAWLALSWVGLRMPYLVAKGWLQVVRHRLRGSRDHVV